MEHLTAADHIGTVAAAAAHDLNNELTVILSSVADSLDTLPPGHPARALLGDAKSAVQRCAWTTSSLLNYTARHGARRVAASLKTLIDYI